MQTKDGARDKIALVDKALDEKKSAYAKLGKEIRALEKERVQLLEVLALPTSRG